MEGKRQRRRVGYGFLGGLVAVVAIILVVQARPEGGTTAEIRTTSYGVPHVLADDFVGVGFGLGYASAESNICALADLWITVNAQRSRYFGPDEEYNRNRATNLTSDFQWARILDMDVVGREFRQPPPVGPTPEVKDLIRGYVAGYNEYLGEVGVDNLPDPRCRGKEWVHPITEMDVYLRSINWNMWRSSGALVKQFVDAAPPTGYVATASLPLSPMALEPGPTTLVPELSSLGSNMMALGKEATDNGKGMLFANPHWSWDGPERWWEFHATVPGKMNVNGAGILGVPIVVFGHTEGVAWSATASTPQRYTIYELDLAPDSPTSYLYDGEVRKMTSRTVTIDVKEADGSLSKRSHTFWETHFGPMVQNEAYAWTSDRAFAIREVAMNFRWLNQTLDMNRANSVEELDAAGQKYLGIGWLNTMAADAAGNTLYADRSAIPYVTNAMLERCATTTTAPLGSRPAAIPALDGSRSECEWSNEASAPIPGIFGVSTLPMLARTDYVTNSNNSYWTNNLHQPLEGFPRIMGDERTARTLRTRIGLLKIERRLNGTDGHPGNQFTLDQLETITMDNRLLAGELWQDSLVAVCRAMPPQEGLPKACDVLAAWDLTQNPDSSGAVLFRRFFENLFPPDAAGAQDVYVVPFDPEDPMNTPSGLNTRNPKIAQALTAAINDLLGSGIPLDAQYGDYHFVERNGTKIAIPGGDAALGQYNLISVRGGWTPGEASEELSGSSYIMWVQFTDEGPVGRSLMTYSQSSNPSSPNYSDQTKLFSQKQSKPILFDEAAIQADPNLKVTKLSVTLSEGESR
jgi:acyl-homoserine-lactone acylase